MSLLQDYCECVKAGDTARMVSLFAQDGRFYDEAPVKAGGQPIDAKGRQSIEAFFQQVFQNGGLTVSNVATNGNAVRYDIEIGGMVLLCLGIMTEENGLIKEYRVTAV